MKTYEELLSDLKAGKVTKVLEDLAETLQDKDPDMLSDVIIMLSRYNQTQRSRNLGTIMDGEAKLIQNQIRGATLKILNQFREKKLLASDPQIEQTPLSPGTKVLFLSANPSSSPLHIDEEMREVKQAIRKSSGNHQMTIVRAPSARPQDLLDEILRERPQIVHFSGHGFTDGLYFIGDNMKPKLVSGEAIMEVFKLFKEVVACVVLNACYAQDQAEAIRKYIPHVIGSSGKLNDAAAIQFSRNFYQALADGRDFQFAFEFARISLKINDLKEGALFTYVP